jgi:hypothetical protein
MTKELRFNKQKITDRRANNFEKKKLNKNLYPSGPSRIAPTSWAPGGRRCRRWLITPLTALDRFNWFTA